MQSVCCMQQECRERYLHRFQSSELVCGAGLTRRAAAGLTRRTVASRMPLGRRLDGRRAVEVWRGGGRRGGRRRSPRCGSPRCGSPRCGSPRRGSPRRGAPGGRAEAAAPGGASRCSPPHRGGRPAELCGSVHRMPFASRRRSAERGPPAGGAHAEPESSRPVPAAAVARGCSRVGALGRPPWPLPKAAATMAARYGVSVSAERNTSRG